MNLRQQRRQRRRQLKLCQRIQTRKRYPFVTLRELEILHGGPLPVVREFGRIESVRFIETPQRREYSVKQQRRRRLNGWAYADS